MHVILETIKILAAQRYRCTSHHIPFHQSTQSLLHNPSHNKTGRHKSFSPTFGATLLLSTLLRLTFESRVVLKGACLLQCPKASEMDLVWAKLEYTTGDSNVFEAKAEEIKQKNVQTLFVHRREYRIGRSAHSELRITDPLISNKHCIVLTKGEAAGKADKKGHFLKAYIRDLNSSNGTSVNNKLLQAGEESLLKSGDVIRLGARVKNPFLPVIRYVAHPVASSREEVQKFVKKPLDNSPAKRRNSRGVLRVEANEKLQEANKLLRKELDESLKQLQDSKESSSKLTLDLEKARLETKELKELAAERSQLSSTIEELKKQIGELKAKNVADMEAAREVQEESKKFQKEQLALAQELNRKLNEEVEKSAKFAKQVPVQERMVKQLRKACKREEAVKAVLQKQVDQFMIEINKLKNEVERLTSQKGAMQNELDTVTTKLKKTEETLSSAQKELMNTKQFAQNTSGRHETQAKRLQLELSETENEKSVMKEKMNWIGENVLAVVQTRNKIMQDLAALNQRLDDVAKQTVDKTHAVSLEEKSVAATQVQTSGTESKSAGPGATAEAYESDAEATQRTAIAEAPTARKRPRLDRVQEEEEDDLQHTQPSTPASNGSAKGNANSAKEKRQRTTSKVSTAETVASPRSAK